jgi:hypothetical protein
MAHPAETGFGNDAACLLAAKQWPGFPPAKDARRPERIPSARLTDCFIERDRERLIIRGIERPPAIGKAFMFDDVDRFSHARVRRRSARPEVIESAEYVVVIAGRKGELEELGIRDLTRRKPPVKQPLE